MPCLSLRVARRLRYLDLEFLFFNVITNVSVNVNGIVKMLHPRWRNRRAARIPCSISRQSWKTVLISIVKAKTWQQCRMDGHTGCPDWIGQRVSTRSRSRKLITVTFIINQVDEKVVKIDQVQRNLVFRSDVFGW
jgi:hypothetical protein